MKFTVRVLARATADADEIFALIREQFRQCARALIICAGENHFAHGVDPIAFKKHMLGAAEPDPFGAERDSIFDLFGRVGICAHPQAAEFVRPLHQLRILLKRDAFLRIE